MNIEKIEKTIGGLKFAVLIILLFSVLMIIGTFLESYYGTEFAGKALYKTIPFMGLQFLMFLSIFFAFLLRLPAKKRLYGFYVIHTGLIIIAAGSFITYYAGVDGNITLVPNTPTNKISLSENQLKITIPEQNKEITYDLPNSAFSKNLNDKFENIKILRYYPFSKNNFAWKKSTKDYSRIGDVHSSQYLLANDRLSENLTLTMHPESFDFKSSLQMGPLSVHYLPKKMGECFKIKSKSSLIIWDSQIQNCYTPESKGIEVKKTSSGLDFLAFRDGDQVITFIPAKSPYPFDRELKGNIKSKFKIFDKKMFTQGRHLFTFGKLVSYYDEPDWIVEELEIKGRPIQLPWMGFELRLEDHSENEVPTLVPEYTLPIQSEGSVIVGNQKSVEIEVQGIKYWITDQRPLALMINGIKHEFRVAQKEIKLPFEFSLNRFKMDKDPGTNSPASYESFVRLFTDKGPSIHHIYMNNPLKYSGFTFYQASYFQTRQGQYGSILSANVDPGRPFKYLGSLFLVFGSAWHYVLNRKKNKKKEEQT